MVPILQIIYITNTYVLILGKKEKLKVKVSLLSIFSDIILIICSDLVNTIIQMHSKVVLYSDSLPDASLDVRPGPEMAGNQRINLRREIWSHGLL